MSRPEPCLVGRDLRFHYRDQQVLNGVDFTLTWGEVVALLGRNGAGKSTLIRLLLGVDRPDGGAVTLDGAPIMGFGRRALARRIAYVPQGHVQPFPYLVRDVVMLGRIASTGLFGSARAEDHLRVDEILHELRLEHLADRPYTRVSGGERQLTLIGRALAQGADLVIMDEPTNGLDYGNQIRLIERVRQLAAHGYGLLITTHNPEQAGLLATRVALLYQGRILCNGPPDEALNPDAIRQLYGVETVLTRTICGRRVLLPQIAQGDEVTCRSAVEAARLTPEAREASL